MQKCWNNHEQQFTNTFNSSYQIHILPWCIICGSDAWQNSHVISVITLEHKRLSLSDHPKIRQKNAAKWPKKNANTSVLWNFIQHIPFHTINTVAFHKVPILHADTWRNVVQKLNRVCFVRNPPVTKVQPPLFRTKTELLTQTKSKCGINPKTQCTNRCKAELFLKLLQN